MNTIRKTTAADPQQPRLLLVDDDEVNLLLTSIALRERGFVVTEAASGRQALDTLACWQPDVVVLDALMPGMDGFETCRELRKLPACVSLPVLMLTGLDDDASINHAYEVGATDFFVKSNQWSLLDGRLRYLLRSSRTRIELERSENSLARAQDLARMGSFEWLVGSSTPDFSPQALRVFQREPHEVLSFGTLVRMLPKEERRGKRTMLVETLETVAPFTRDIPMRLPDGQVHIVHLEASPETTESGKLIGYSGIVQDVTDRWNAEYKIRQLANFDSLTGLPNRRAFNARLSHLLAQQGRQNTSTSLVLMDVDFFKSYNDAYGHPAGDAALVHLAECFKTTLRRELDMPARLGGEEFGALLELTDAEQAMASAEKLRLAVLALDMDHRTGLPPGRVTISCGVAEMRPGDTSTTLYQRADKALYLAKAAGRNRVALAE
jgi:diguanylate cyclase (GGDEF)-like protein